MIKSETKVTRYEDGDYWVDIVETEEHYEAWIGVKEYDMSSIMIASIKAHLSYDDFLHAATGCLKSKKEDFLKLAEAYNEIDTGWYDR